MLLGAVTLTVIASIVIPDLPDIEALRDVKMQIPLRVYSHDGSLIAEFGEMRRIPVSIKETPQQMINAFIAAEDDRFYVHPGVDWQGILRAAINLLVTGDRAQGGSTITMQVARNFFLSNEKTYMRKINEIFLALKIEQELDKDEILELYLNKIYLGQRAYGIGAAAQVYYGTGIGNLDLAQIAMIAGLPKAPSTTNPITSSVRSTERRGYVLGRMLDLGFITADEFARANDAIETASLHKPAVQSEAPYVAEMARLEMVRQYGDEATTAGYKVYTTIRDRNQAAANHALRSAVIEYDVRHGYRGPEGHVEPDSISNPESAAQLLLKYPVIANLYPAVVTGVREQSVSVYLSGIGSIDIGWEGLQWARKYLSENSRGAAPKTASEILAPGDIIRVVEDDEGKWKLSQLPEVEGALVSLDPNNGATLALTGGFDFYRSNFNRVTQARRQPGSGFKPFVYSAALEEGFTTASIINDAPLVREIAGVEEAWRPENYSGKYYGPTRFREALIQSRNIVSIRLLDSIGVDKALGHIARFGFDTDKLPHTLSLALGSGDLSPWQMASAYCVFANGGYRVEPYFIERIINDSNTVIFEANPAIVCRECQDTPATPEPAISAEQDAASIASNAGPGESPAVTDQVPVAIRPTQRYAERAVDAQNIWIMNSITRDVVRRGTATRALELKRQDLAGKTGTTNDQHDAWFFGYNPSVVAVAWVGFDDFHGLGTNEVGGRAALPMWIDYMRVALDGIPESVLVEPPGLVTARIDPATGKLASADNPDAIFEVFRANNVPTGQEGPEGQNPFQPRGPEVHTPQQLF